MTNIIVHGLVSNKYITQGYHSGAAPSAPTAGGWRGFYRLPEQKRINPELLRLLIEWLELELAESP